MSNRIYVWSKEYIYNLLRSMLLKGQFQVPFICFQAADFMPHDKCWIMCGTDSAYSTLFLVFKVLLSDMLLIRVSREANFQKWPQKGVRKSWTGVCNGYLEAQNRQWHHRCLYTCVNIGFQNHCFLFQKSSWLGYWPITLRNDSMYKIF